MQRYCSVHYSTCTRTTAIHVPVPVPVLTHLLLLCSTTCFTSAPWTRKMPSRSPCPNAAEAQAVRPGAGRRRAWVSRGHFGGRCCLTAGATTNHSPDASRLRHPDQSIDHNITWCTNSSIRGYLQHPSRFRHVKHREGHHIGACE